MENTAKNYCNSNGCKAVAFGSEIGYREMQRCLNPQDKNL